MPGGDCVPQLRHPDPEFKFMFERGYPDGARQNIDPFSKRVVLHALSPRINPDGAHDTPKLLLWQVLIDLKNLSETFLGATVSKVS